jgi:hypothetical protein
MLLTKYKTTGGSRWAVDGKFLLPTVNLSALLEMPSASILEALVKYWTTEPAIRKEEAPMRTMDESLT